MVARDASSRYRTHEPAHCYPSRFATFMLAPRWLQFPDSGLSRRTSSSQIFTSVNLRPSSPLLPMPTATDGSSRHSSPVGVADGAGTYSTLRVAHGYLRNWPPSRGRTGSPSFGSGIVTRTRRTARRVTVLAIRSYACRHPCPQVRTLVPFTRTDGIIELSLAARQGLGTAQP